MNDHDMLMLTLANAAGGFQGATRVGIQRLRVEAIKADLKLSKNERNRRITALVEGRG